MRTSIDGNNCDPTEHGTWRVRVSSVQKHKANFRLLSRLKCMWSTSRLCSRAFYLLFAVACWDYWKPHILNTNLPGTCNPIFATYYSIILPTGWLKVICQRGGEKLPQAEITCCYWEERKWELWTLYDSPGPLVRFMADVCDYTLSICWTYTGFRVSNRNHVSLPHFISGKFASRWHSRTPLHHSLTSFEANLWSQKHLES